MVDMPAKAARAKPHPLPPKAPRFMQTTPAAASIWDRPPPPEKGDAEISAIHLAVGEALSRWETFEEELAGLFSAFIGLQQDSSAARRAYGAITLFSLRREMLNAAATAYFDQFPNPECRKAFKALMMSAQNASERRNDIAHGIARSSGFHFMTDIGFLLFPSYASTKGHNLAKPRTIPNYAYNSEQIREFGIQFMNMFPLISPPHRAILLRIRQPPTPSQP
jgi:hypothetical protein